ncbi:uncharacterized protein LOC105437989 [Strongylocentrotus purpuratus]|uniref:Uncharacterized protein n=1 Tax=Strongylocentrotus purpuratus TaxID=7668 RepID=A0A7M7NJG9_STRPU|nr:uncharacterized protein LOC105437989 [Strongylocentrotus purpuratus]
MAIMQSCCCFSNVRSGSIACGVYSLVTSCIYLAVWSWNLVQAVNLLTGYSGPTVDGIYAAYSIDIILAAFLLIASIILIVGVPLHNKTMLIPYMVGVLALIVFQAIAWIILFVLLGAVSIVLIVNLVVWLLFTALNITCLICVISQYQELSEGRGRAMMT